MPSPSPFLLLALLAACGPRIDAGPAAAALAPAPPAWTDIAPDGGDDEIVAIAAFAGSSFDPVGKEGAACRPAWTPGGATERCGRDVTVATRSCPTNGLVECAQAFADAWRTPPASAAEGARAWLTTTAFADPGALAVELLDDAIYAAHPYGHPPAGRLGVVDVVGDADVASVAATRRVRATTAAAGPPAARAAVQQALEALPARIVRPRPLISPLAATGARRRACAAPRGAALAVGAPVGTLRDPDGAWLGLAALAASIGRQTGLEVAASWGELGAPVAGLDLTGPRQSPRLVLRLEGTLVGVPAAVDAAWTAAHAGALDEGDVAAGRSALLAAAADPTTRAASAAAHGALGVPDPAQTDWASIASARAAAALADPALPDHLRAILVHAEAVSVEDTIGPDVQGADRFDPIPVPSEVFR